MSRTFSPGLFQQQEWKDMDYSLATILFQQQNWEETDYSLSTIGSSPEIFDLALTEEESQVEPLTSSELLKQYGTKVKRLREDNLNEQSSNTPRNAYSCQGLSTESIMKLAKARLLQFNYQKADVISSVARCFGAQSSLLSEVSADLELALLLQAAGEKVANQQFVHARRLLSMCCRSASKSGSPVQRIVYYFTEALQERIDREWGIISSHKPVEKPIDEKLAFIGLEPAIMECQQEIPFCLVTQFASTESILENVGSAKRVHLIDFAIENGSQWTMIMQAFAARHECPLELLKITAVGTYKEMMEGIGKWLSSFAETINLPFSFEILVSDLKNLKEDFFELEADEAVAVHLAFRFWTQLASPNHLEALIGVIKNLKPCVIMVRELELCSTSPIFLERFDEALFYLSAMFDCMNTCMGHHILYRKLVEEVYMREMIQNIITAEGSERYQRYERVAFWRALFARFGMVETNLSSLSLCQTSLLLRRSERLSSCSLHMDGKCLLLGWKGTPLESISAWKFNCK